jgi:uncharacterized membrane protein YfcA
MARTLMMYARISENRGMTYVWFGLVVLITHFIEGITGFGCTVLALPFCILLVGAKTAVPVLVFHALVLAYYIIIIDKKSIQWKEFLKIVAFVGLGLPVGIALFTFLDERILKAILGVFMVFIGARGLATSIFNWDSRRRLPAWVYNGALLLGGCIHGAFGSGGPLVVIYAQKALPDKSHFRATICMLWTALNTVMVAQSLARGTMTAEIWAITGVTMPFLIGGAIIGNWAHHRIQDHHFTQLVYLVLLVSGLFMLQGIAH